MGGAIGVAGSGGNVDVDATGSTTCEIEIEGAKGGTKEGIEIGRSRG